jgi:hypothetical protein
MKPRRLRPARPGYTRRKRPTLAQMVEQQFALLQAMREGSKIAAEIAASALSGVNLSAGPKDGSHA